MMKIPEIAPLDAEAMRRAQEKIDSQSKPLGSLGSLEEYAVRLAGIRSVVGGSLERKAVLVFAADNGVYEQDITSVPKAVTAVQAAAIANGMAGVSVLARHAGAEVSVYNVGVEAEVPSAHIKNHIVMRGTNDIACGPAMTAEQCGAAMQAGYAAVEEHSGAGVIGLGEMGICNTTTSAAVACALLGLPVRALTGRGAGITDLQLDKKVAVIERALEVNQPNQSDVMGVIAKVGGLDIAAMTGAYLACAARRIPVVIDGFISAVSALCAVRIAPGAAEYLFASHKSSEPGYRMAIGAMGMKPAFDLSMRLGEGSGCPLLFHLLDASLKLVDEMGSFEDTSVDASEFVDLRNGKG